MSIIYKALQKVEKENTLKQKDTSQSVLVLGKADLITTWLSHKKKILIIAGSSFLLLGSVGIYIANMPSKGGDEHLELKSTGHMKKDAGTTSSADTIKKALQAYKEGDLKKSIELFNEVLKQNVANPLIHNNIGLAYLKNKEFQKAEEHFTKSIALNKDCFECLNNLGLLKIKQEKYDEAHTAFSKALVINKNYADAYFNQAVLYENEGNYAEAVNNYTQFVFLAREEHSKLVETVNRRIERLLESNNK